MKRRMRDLRNIGFLLTHTQKINYLKKRVYLADKVDKSYAEAWKGMIKRADSFKTHTIIERMWLISCIKELMGILKENMGEPKLEEMIGREETQEKRFK